MTFRTIGLEIGCYPLAMSGKVAVALLKIIPNSIIYLPKCNLPKKDIEHFELSSRIEENLTIFNGRTLHYTQNITLK